MALSGWGQSTRADVRREHDARRSDRSDTPLTPTASKRAMTTGEHVRREAQAALQSSAHPRSHQIFQRLARALVEGGVRGYREGKRRDATPHRAPDSTLQSDQRLLLSHPTCPNTLKPPIPRRGKVAELTRPQEVGGVGWAGSPKFGTRRDRQRWPPELTTHPIVCILLSSCPLRRRDIAVLSLGTGQSDGAPAAGKREPLEGGRHNHCLVVRPGQQGCSQAPQRRRRPQQRDNGAARPANQHRARPRPNPAT